MTTREDVLNQFSEHPVWRGIGCGPGWLPIIIECHEKLLAINPNYRIVQIKEKFGGLRYYLESETPEMSEVIRAAEQKALVTCESCGQPGTLREGGWWHTHCDTCEIEYQERRKQRNAGRKA